MSFSQKYYQIKCLEDDVVSDLPTSKICVRDTTSGLLSEPSVGDQVDAFWEKDKCYYPGVIEDQ